MAKIPNQQRVIGFGQILTAIVIIAILGPVFFVDAKEFYQGLKENDFDIWPWIRQEHILWLVIKLIIIGQFLLYGVISFFSGSKQLFSSVKEENVPKDYVDINVVQHSIVTAKTYQMVSLKGISAKLARFLLGKRLTTAPDFLQIMASSVARSSCRYAFLAMLMVILPYIPTLKIYEPHLSKVAMALAMFWGAMALILLVLLAISLPLRKAKSAAVENRVEYQNVLGHFRTLMQQMIGKSNDFREQGFGNRTYPLQSYEKGEEATDTRVFEGNFLVETKPIAVGSLPTAFISLVFMALRAALLGLIALVLASEFREYFIKAMEWIDIDNFIFNHNIPHEQLVAFGVGLTMIFILFGAIGKLANTLFEIAATRSHVYMWKSNIFVGKIAGRSIQKEDGVDVVCTEATVTVYATQALSYTGGIAGERKLFSFKRNFSLEEKADILAQFFQGRSAYSRPSAPPPSSDSHKNLMDDEIAKIDRETKRHLKKDF